VAISVTDSNGNPMDADTVTYTLDGGASQTAISDETGFYLLWDDPGLYEITATACEGAQERTVSIEVEGGECGVDSAADNDVALSFDACDT